MEKSKFFNGNFKAILTFIISAVVSFVLITVGIIGCAIDGDTRDDSADNSSGSYYESIYLNSAYDLTRGDNKFSYYATSSYEYFEIYISNYHYVNSVSVEDSSGRSLLNTSSSRSTYTFYTRSTGHIYITVNMSSGSSYSYLRLSRS